MLAERRRRQELLRALKGARSYAEYQIAAEELDQLEGKEAFKREDPSRDYDHVLIRERLTQLKHLRAAHDDKGLVFYLRQGLHRNLGNLGNPSLYEETRTGTKHLIDDYVTAVIAAINYVTDTDFDWFPQAQKLTFLEQTLQSFGRSALLLSGGANFGVFHIGVLRALWAEGLLPRVFSGASTGAIIAGMLGTHADDELDRIFRLDPTLRLDAWESLPLLEARRTGGMFSQAHLEEVVRHNVGPHTFLEAFEKTGRAINISVTPAAATDQQARLLNYLTTPHILVWSAVMASCALPIIFPPVVMLMKTHEGMLEPYMHGMRWIDGSMKSDLPMQRLGEVFNVNHHVVSQANPHIAPLVQNGMPRSHVVRLVRELTLGELHHRSRQVLSVLRTAAPVQAAEQVMEAFDSVFAQRYEGDITISPETKLARYLRIVRNLRPADAEELARAGEVATYRRMSQIRNETKIGQTLERCVRRTKARLSTSATADAS